MILQKIRNNITQPRQVAKKILERLSPYIKSDTLYIKLRYWIINGYWLNLESPKTFNEKQNWLKINYHNPLYATLVDKYSVKNHVANLIGPEHIIPTLGVWDTADDIDFNSLPEQFVMKTTHDSGGIIVCTDKSKLNIQEVRKQMSIGIRRDYSSVSREWGYKNVPHRIIAEQYTVDSKTGVLDDYKFFCFDGKVRIMFIATDRQIGEVKFDFYDKDFNHLNIINGHPMATIPPLKPKSWDKMIEIAEKLSKGFPFMRIDLYEVDGKVYFGEYTAYHFGASIKFEPFEWDEIMGNWLNLPEIKR